MRLAFLMILMAAQITFITANSKAEFVFISPQELTETINAAQKNDKEAILLLTVHYAAEGDMEQFIKWAKKGASIGIIQSMRNLADIYWSGDFNIKRDKKEALKWAKMGSDAGDELCQKAYKKMLTGD